MARIIVEQRVQCPPQAASKLIEAAIRDIGHDGAVAVRVPLVVHGKGEIALEHEVQFHATYTRDASGLNDVVAVAWEPDSRFPMPAFHGQLTADWNPDATEAVLTLDGSYDPPGGIAGDAFDELVGENIARATMTDLLARTAAAIEAEYRRSAEPTPQLNAASGPFGKVLVAHDGSQASDIALDVALDFATPVHGEIVIANVSDLSAPSVIAPPTEAANAAPVQPVLDALDPYRRHLFTHLRKRVASCTVPVTLEFSTNGIAAGILDAAARWNATAVALGTEGREGLPLLFAGSVADETLRAASIPIIIVRERTKTLYTRRVVVGIDGTAPSEGAARFAIAVAQERNARLIFCMVAHQRVQATSDASNPTPLLSGVRGAAADALEQGLQYASEAGVPADTELIDEDDAPAALLRAAERQHADMIVVGTHARKGVDRVVLGSTAERLIRTSPIPVIVVPLRTPVAQRTPTRILP